MKQHKHIVEFSSMSNLILYSLKSYTDFHFPASSIKDDEEDDDDHKEEKGFEILIPTYRENDGATENQAPDLSSHGKKIINRMKKGEKNQKSKE